MKNEILTVTLNPALDKFVLVDGLKAGQECRGLKITLSAGGKGINVSRALKNLGLPSVATGFVGGRNGKWLQQELKREEIFFAPVIVIGETRINNTFCDVHKKVFTRVLEPGAAIAANKVSNLKKKIAALLRGKRYMVISGRNAEGVPDNIYNKLTQLANDHGVRVIVDASGRALKPAISARPFLLKVNETEAAALWGQKIRTVADLRRAAECFQWRGAEKVIISLGADGAFASDGTSTFMVSAPISANNTHAVGCGDAMVAGFLWAQTQAFQLEDSVRFAVAAGTANVHSIRPGEIIKHLFLKLAKKVRVKKI